MVSALIWNLRQCSIQIARQHASQPVGSIGFRDREGADKHAPHSLRLVMEGILRMSMIVGFFS